jgi:thioredoxin reductase (NADPH)
MKPSLFSFRMFSTEEKPMDNKIVDAIVIGAGPAGITAGIYLKRSNLNAVVLDKDAPGGKLNNIHRIDNYPGAPEIAGPDLAMKFVEQATSLGVTLDYGDVISVSQDGDRFLVHTDNGDYSALAVIVATGVKTVSSGVNGEKQLRGRGVSYCATCDGNFFKGKTIMVVGYKDHAAEDAIYLSSLASKVYFVNPSPLEALESHVEALKHAENVEIMDGKLVEIEGDTRVSGAKIATEDGEKEIATDAVFPLFGEISSSEFLAPLGVNSNKGFIEADAEMKTNVPGLYVAGDVVNKKLRQIVNAAGEGAVAATSAIAYVHAKKK